MKVAKKEGKVKNIERGQRKRKKQRKKSKEGDVKDSGK